jgi:UPF0176 protein
MITVAALYRFARFANPAAIRGELLAACVAQGIKGTLLIAREGINGTIAGPESGVAAVVAYIRTLPDCADLELKFSTAATMPFHRLKVRVKREIVTMGQPDIDPRGSAGTYVAPADWNALIDAPDTIVIDTRNDYEVKVGTFAHAIDPKTRSFSDFPGWFQDHREELSGKRVAMFCTGGIRCEKATALLKAEGVEQVYHLQGGILKYLEEIPPEQSRWQGECFVFDERVAVGHGLAPGTHGLCRACRMPVSPADRQSPLYAEGISCPACHGTRDAAARASYAERHRQVKLAEARGQAHVGAVFNGDVSAGASPPDESSR